MNTLYHYVHCPFCVRVRMALGYLEEKYISKVLPYDDENTPVDLTGTKMLPIFKIENQKAMNESLDIIKAMDKENKLQNQLAKESKLEELLSEIGSNVHSLCMPYWIFTPEFNKKSRKYFQDKKEKKRGPFNQLILNKETYLKGLELTLKKVEEELNPYYQSDVFTIKDIMIASHLWGMYIFPEFQFSEKIHKYLQGIKKDCNFEYHEDFWKAETLVKELS